MTKFLTFLFLFITFSLSAQESDTEKQSHLNELYAKFRKKEMQDSIRAEQLAQSGNMKIVEIDKNGEVVRLVGFEPNGFPVFYANDNANAAATVGTDLIVAGAVNGYGLTGNGMIIGEWDGGSVLGTHQELTGRIIQVDSPSSTSDHSTHVAGTMIASGVTASAKGMATAATISAHDYSNDDSEMTTFSANGLLSNHSYGRISGWYETSGGDWRWYGDTTISGVEDYMFGFYSYNAQSWDLIANAAPYYLIVKSAGNDRNDVLPSSVSSHFVRGASNNWVASTVSRTGDGGTDGYDCIASSGNAKNILTVGAVSDISAGYSQPSDVSMSSFSGWGPTDDGRIKPDIVANGVSLYSTGADNNTDYYSSSGTSMSAPNATGSMALLQEMYSDSNAVFMTASSLKGLVIHTANEAGLTGPDFKFGWGLLNVKGAADIIADSVQNKIIEATLINLTTDTYTFYADGTSDVEATIVWNDPAGTIPSAALDPTTAILVNDLDLRISNSTGTIKLPWVVNGATPSIAATKGDNVKDNVEHVIFDSPSAGTYTFTVSHKSSLFGIVGTQDYSLIISGVSQMPTGPTPVASFTATATTICEGDSVYFTDSSTGNPTSIEWTFTGGNPSTATNATPGVGYTTAGIYTVKLKAINANGIDSVEQTNYVTVLAAPVITTTAFSDQCVSNGALTLTGATPASGVWSGSGVSSGAFDPMVAGIGTHTLTYTVSNGTCSSSATETISVVNSPVVNLPNFSTSICDNSAAFLLSGGTPLGGVYSGPGISNNMFDPSVSGMGSHLVTYTYSNAAGCSDFNTATLTVLPGTAVTLGSFNDVCDSSSLVILSGGSPTTGYYTGTGVDTLNGTFDPTIAGVGTHTITYFASGGFCISAATNTITVNPLPIVVLSPLTDECLATTSVTLSGGSPLGGVYSGTAVVNGIFDPSIAGAGTHWVYYNYTDLTTGCSGVDSTTINVVNSIQLQLNDTTLCENGSAFMLTGGMPSGGTYSGFGVSGSNMFDPAAARVGIHAITYADTTNACATPAVANYTVTISPRTSLASISDICLTGGIVPLTGGLPTGGTYSGIGVTNNEIDPLVNGVGTVMITYSVTANGCTDTSSQMVVIGVGSPEITNIKTSYCVNGNSIVFIGNPAGGTYAGSGMSDSIFDPNVAGTGTHTIVYTTTGGCAGTNSYAIQVNPKPAVGNITGPLISSQNLTAPYQVDAQNGAFYDWFITDGVIVSNSNNQVTVNWDASPAGMLEVVMVDQNGCRDTASLSVVLWPVSVGEIEIENQIQMYPNPVKDEVHFTGTVDKLEQLELVIINVSGQQVYSVEKSIEKGDFNWNVNVDSWSTGAYFYLLQSKDVMVGQGQFLKH